MKEEFEKVLKDCKDISDKVKAYIVLAVTDEKNGDGTQGGINVANGYEPDLVNLVLNIDDDLFKKAAFSKTMALINKSFDDEEEEELKVVN